MKKVIYTCITGNYDTPHKHDVVDNTFDYICFTDNKQLIEKGEYYHWRVLPLVFSELSNVKNARWHKINAHIVLPQYDYSLWVDGNINIKNNDIFKKIAQYIKMGVKIAVPLHPIRECIYDEAKYLIKHNYDKLSTIVKEVLFLKFNRYPSNNGLHETCIIFRNHNVLKDGMSEWWRVLRKYSKRDQLSFDYAMWKNDIKVEPMYNNHRDNGFFEFIYGARHNGKMTKRFGKIKTSDGKCKIVLFGIPIMTYKRKNKNENKIMQWSNDDFINWARSQGVKIGDNCNFIIHPYPFSIPDLGSEPYFIEFGNNILCSFGCTFLTHDGARHTCSQYWDDSKEIRKYGKIVVKDNSFIGCRSIIMPKVTIGTNCVVGAGSVVTKNIPDGEVWAGNPARYICTTEQLAKKMEINFNEYQKDLKQVAFMHQIDNDFCKAPFFNNDRK